MVQMDTSGKNTENREKEELIVQRRGGGSLIDQKPCFSRDGEKLFVIWGPDIRLYSVQTGELVRDYDGVKSRAVGVYLNPNNSNFLIACTEKGHILEWEWKKMLPAKHIKVQLPFKYGVVDFQLLGSCSTSSGRQCTVLMSLANKKKKFIQIHAFYSGSGNKMWKKPLEIKLEGHRFTFSIGQNEILMAGISGNVLHVADISDFNWSKPRQYKNQFGGPFTCVTCHPTESSVLTGDVCGRVLLWTGFQNKTGPVSAEYHWHTLPVRDIAFSHAGSNFYSVGGEGVLVKWTVNSPHQKDFLPRLPAPLKYVLVAPDNAFLAVATEDNAIQLIGSDFKMYSLIQHFSSRVPQKHMKQNLFPAGLTTDPRTESLVLNGRTGYIQFFSTQHKSLIYVVHITGQNLLTQERNKTIVNTDVMRLTFSSDGRWLATAEHRDDGVTSSELRLKFWEFSHIKQTYCLNTSIEQPHKGEIFDLKFQPSPESKELLAVSTGDDLKFRVWSLVDHPSIYRMSQVWCNDSVGYYRHLPVGPISFSSDGSLLAAAFGPTLTVWVPETIQQKCSLTPSDAQHDIRHVEFGSMNCLHLVVTGSPAGIAVWNLLSLSLVWLVHLPLSTLVADPRSDLMAAFTVTNDLVVFSPNSPEPVYQKRSLLTNGSNILAGAFVPHPRLNRGQKVSWQRDSQLYFLNSDQELFTLEHSDDMLNEADGKALDSLPIASQHPLTAFGAMVAQHTSTDVSVPGVEQHRQLGVVGGKSIKELLTAPAHTMPSISLLCWSLLHSLIETVPRSSTEACLNAPKDDVGSAIELIAEDSVVDDDKDNITLRGGLVYCKQKEEIQSSSKKGTALARSLEFANLETKLAPILKEPMHWTASLTSDRSS